MSFGKTEGSPEARPIFILASGWRTGSTLLQRLLCSHPEIHIWGENRGLCDDLARLYRTVCRYQPNAARAAWDYQQRATDGWIANLSPPPQRFLDAAAVMLDHFLAEPARELGKPRWGFKEVRHERDAADFLRLLFPSAQFLLLVRDPADCLASARATQRTWRLLDEVGGPDALLAHWERTARSFLDRRDETTERLIRFEDLISDPRKAVTHLGSFLGVDPSAFREDVFRTRRRGWADDEPRLTVDDLTVLRSSAIWDVAGQYGYRMHESL